MFFYNSVIFFYSFAVRITSLFNPKARLWITGRKNWRSKLNSQLKKIESSPKIWIHCASLGEFEQGRPVIEALKKKYPTYKIILSFFSPSGYEQQKNYELADVVTYLPSDTKQNALDFINCFNPKAVIFIKYEFWLNYLFQLQLKNIPVYLISAIIKSHQPFFKWYGKNFTKALHTFKKVLVQDEDSLKLLQTLQINTGVICGDTRMDRVLSISQKSFELPEIKKFCANNFVIVAGSTWPKDEIILLNMFSKLKSHYPTIKLIIAPHEIDEKNIVDMQQKISQQNNSCTLYTKHTKMQSPNEKDILILNTVGILSSVYKFGKIAYVGGGFGKGIHNVLEPAVFGLPVIFGPNHKKFIEPHHLLALGGATEIADEESLLKTIENYFENTEILQKASKACLNYVNLNKGATVKIIEQLQID